MRELKEAAFNRGITPKSAAAQIPMMRELKEIYSVSIQSTPLRCSPNPYDEGTESSLVPRRVDRPRRAAAQIPMMRELKVSLWLRNISRRRLAAAQIPMMRELKGQTACRPPTWPRAAAQIPMMRELKGIISASSGGKSPSAAAQIPMMRELKGEWAKYNARLANGCSPNPYDEGTERST